MGLVNSIIFDNLDSKDFGVFLSGEGAYNAPARRGEMVTVPGRNGTIFMGEDAFENIEVVYPAFMARRQKIPFGKDLRDLRSEFSARKTYKRLEDTYHPDEFRLGVFHAGVETDPVHYTRAGGFELIFDCKPQRFLKSGENAITFTRLGNITNPTPFAAKPLIKVTGYGTVSIGNYQFEVSGNPGTLWIDSELMEVYVPAGETYYFTEENDVIMTDEHGFDLTFADGLVNPESMLKYVTFKDHKFPLIEPGTQAVDMSSTITELVIIPRWWLL